MRHAGAGPSPNGGGRPTQPTVLVSSDHERLVRRAPRELLAERVRPRDDVVLITGERSRHSTGRLCRAVDQLSSESVAVVTMAAGDPTDDPANPPVGDTPDGVVPATVERLPNAPEPAALLAAVERAYDALENGSRVHLLGEELAGTARPPGPEERAGTVTPESEYARVHELMMVAGARPGLAVGGVGAERLPADAVESLAHLFGVHVRLRDGAGEPEARWTALTGGSDGWYPWQAVEVPLGGPR